MGKIVWSPTAYKDIDLIAEYIANDSFDRATSFIKKIIEQTDKLKFYPKAGRKIPELNDESIRETIYGSYRIMYRLLKNGYIRITGVVHGARDWKPS